MAALAPGQNPKSVWSNTVMCANCKLAYGKHRDLCNGHLVPCCPGTCKGMRD
jgi:hypothetical protein